MSKFEDAPERRGVKRPAPERVVMILGSLAGTSVMLGAFFTTNVAAWQAEQNTPSAKSPAVLQQIVAYEDSLEMLAGMTLNNSLDECANNNLQIGEYHLVQHLPPENATLQQRKQYLEQTYGLTISFPEEQVAIGDTYVAAPVSTADEIPLTSVYELQKTLALFDADFVRAAKLKVVFTGKIASQTTDGSPAQGLYVESDDAGSVYVDATDWTTVSGTLIHEFGHVFDDRIFCEQGDDFQVDAAFADHNDQAYVMPAPNSVIPATEDIAFWSNYAMTNVVEDRAETMRSILDGGLILPGDQSWNSPLQEKQAELLTRYEAATPGFIENLFKTL